MAYSEPLSKKILFLDFLRWRRQVNRGTTGPMLHHTVCELLNSHLKFFMEQDDRNTRVVVPFLMNYARILRRTKKG